MRLVVAAALARDSTCIDVGANVGDFLELCVAIAPEGHHVAYEPIPELADGLRARFPSVDVRARAVSERPGVEPFTHVVQAPALSGLGARAGPAGHRIDHFDVEVVSLDSDLPSDLAPRLIKLDIEGTETLVIRGATETIRRNRPTLIFERGWEEWAPDLYREVSALEMEVFDLFGHGPYSLDSFTAASRERSVINFVAWPATRQTA
jgi:FkbM family methyltransferase